MSPKATSRWWESARHGRIFCGPAPDGHHIPARFDFNESGFIQCEARVGLPPELLELKRLRESQRFPEAERLEAQLRAAGMEAPDLATLRTMSREAGICGNWVFLYAIRGGGVVVVRVSPADRKAMKELSTPAEMIEYLQIFPTR